MKCEDCEYSNHGGPDDDLMSDCTWCKWNWKNHEDFYKKREDKNEV